MEKVEARQTLNVEEFGLPSDFGFPTPPNLLRLGQTGLSPVKECVEGTTSPTSPRPFTWDQQTVQLQLPPGSKLGLTLDVSDEHCCLVKTASPEGILANRMAVSAGMRLLEANGARGSTQAILKKVEETCRRGGLLDLTFERPQEFCFDISKHGNDDLGIVLKPLQNAVGIASISGGGIIADYNTSVPEERRIGLSSRIIAVDGSSAGGGHKMMETMQSDQAFTVAVLNWSTLKCEEC